MLKFILVLLAAVPACAAVNSPLEADFPEGYWERDNLYYGATVTSYNISLAAKDPSAMRAQVEAVCKDSKATLAGFTDQTQSLAAAAAYPRLSPEYSMLPRSRMVYSLSYRLPVAGAAALARRLTGLGRLISYTSNVPYGRARAKELYEKIEWIEREQKEAGPHLKTMPVSRALLVAKLKALRQAKDAAEASEGVATLTIQVLLDEAEKAAEDATR
jgi:histone H3/H4